jgi:hypothetical protein
MNQELEFNTIRYEWAHRRKPRGYRLWYFRMPDGLTFYYSGTYSEARQAAAIHAHRRYRGVQVCIQLCA